MNTNVSIVLVDTECRDGRHVVVQPSQDVASQLAILKPRGTNPGLVCTCGRYGVVFSPENGAVAWRRHGVPHAPAAPEHGLGFEPVPDSIRGTAPVLSPTMGADDENSGSEEAEEEADRQGCIKVPFPEEGGSLNAVVPKGEEFIGPPEMVARMEANAHVVSGDTSPAAVAKKNAELRLYECMLDDGRFVTCDLSWDGKTYTLFAPGGPPAVQVGQKIIHARPANGLQDAKYHTFPEPERPTIVIPPYFLSEEYLKGLEAQRERYRHSYECLIESAGCGGEEGRVVFCELVNKDSNTKRFKLLEAFGSTPIPTDARLTHYRPVRNKDREPFKKLDPPAEQIGPLLWEAKA